jgi:hypothetical protein
MPSTGRTIFPMRPNDNGNSAASFLYEVPPAAERINRRRSSGDNLGIGPLLPICNLLLDFTINREVA